MIKTLRYSLFLLFAACVAQTAFAKQVVFDFDTDYATLFPNVGGVSSGTGALYDPAGEFNENGVATIDGVTITVEASPADAQTRNRIWTSSPRLRMYNSTLTIAAAGGSKITSVVIDLAKSASSAKFDAGNTTNTGAFTVSGTQAVWSGDATDNIVLTVAKNTQMMKMTVYLDEEGPVAPEPDEHIFSQTFLNGLGAFTIDNKELGGLDFVWADGKQYGAKASAYTDAAHAAEASLISPVIDLAGCKNIVMTFEHAVNKGTATNLKVAVRADGADTAVDGIDWPAGTSWNFQSAGNISLEQYAGKKIQLVFTYKSTETDCPTWEVKNLLIDGEKSTDGIENVEAGKADAKQVIYNMAGQRMEKMQKGLNIVNGKKIIKRQ